MKTRRPCLTEDELVERHFTLGEIYSAAELDHPPGAKYLRVFISPRRDLACSFVLRWYAEETALEDSRVPDPSRTDAHGDIRVSEVLEHYYGE